MKTLKLLLTHFIIIVLFFITDPAYAANFIVDNLGDANDGGLYTEADGTNTLRKCISLAGIVHFAQDLSLR